MDIRIKNAESKNEINQFIDFPHELYKDDPNYVPEVFIAQKKLFDKKKNPFFKHADANFFVAEKNGKIEGRIALIKNGNYNVFTGEPHGFFGFFDVTDDYEVAEKLLHTAIEWAKKNNFSHMIGPVNFSTNDTCGILIDGYDSPPAIMMTYQKKYHQDFLERFGFGKKMDLLAYRLMPENTEEKVLEMHDRIEDRLLKKGITIRKLNLKNFEKEVQSLREVYNAAWEKNWGFVPMTEAEFDFSAEDMKSIVDVDFAYIAEHNGKAIGFSLTIPNLNEVFIRMKRGRLFPTGIFKLLYHKNKVKSVRVLTLGVNEEYRKAGIDACFYARSIKTAREKNIQWAEASWILENNQMMNRALQNIGGKVYKRYRIYEMPI
jgi:GNAT superfamily N-acetyltransferase